MQEVGHIALLVAAALRDLGFHVSDAQSHLDVIGVPGGAVAKLRAKAGFWLLDIPLPGGGQPVIRALGRTSASLSEVTGGVRDALAANWPTDQLPSGIGRSLNEPAQIRRAPVADLVAVETLERLRPILTGGAGLSGPVHEQLYGAEPCLVIESPYGQVVVRVVNDRVVIDSRDLDGAPARFVVGVVGRPEGPTARRAVAAARTLTGATLGRGLFTVSEGLTTLSGLLEHLGAYLATADDGVLVLMVPSTSTHNGAMLCDFARVVIAAGPYGLDVLGTFGSQTPAEIADEVSARLLLTPEEQQSASDAWAQHGPGLTQRLALLADSVRDGSDTEGAAKHLHAALMSARDRLEALGARGGLEALGEADDIVRDLEAAVIGARPDAAGPRPAPRLIRNWRDAEACAAEWMEWFGLGAARLTGGSADGGVDVECESAVGQVKDYGSPLAVGPIREIFAVGTLAGKLPVIFARAGYTGDAVAWGESAGVAMFAFDLQGTPEPVSTVAHELMAHRA